METVDETTPGEPEDDPEGFFQVPEGHRSGFATLVGRPNVGKSTLLNSLMRQTIAGVSPRPQTTRTRQLGILTQPDYQIVLMDTPGIVRRTRHKLDEFMVATALQTIDDSDVVVWLVDSSEPPGAGDREIAARLAALDNDTPVILALNKIDKTSSAEVLANANAYHELVARAQPIHLSALQDEGVDSLLAAIVASLPEGPRYYPEDQITDVYIRDIAAEFVRAQIMNQMEEEIPYGTAVVVREYKERDNGTIYINADIYVERENHKGMLIGSGGSQLKKIGSAARSDLEELVEGKVFLDLWVKVRPNWRRDERILKQFGYEIQSD